MEKLKISGHVACPSKTFFLEAREFVSTSSLVLRASDSSEDLSDLVSRRSTCSSSRA